MSIAHLSYVVCNGCGLPASQPVENRDQARMLIPKDWGRFRNGNRVTDLCPTCNKTGERYA